MALIPGKKKYPPALIFTKGGMLLYSCLNGQAGSVNFVGTIFSEFVALSYLLCTPIIGSTSSYNPTKFVLLIHVCWINSNCRLMSELKQIKLSQLLLRKNYP